MSKDTRFVRVFLSPDEPTEVRQRNELEHLKRRTIRDSKCAVESGGVLVVDDVTVFYLLEHGSVCSSANAAGDNVSSVTDG